MGLLQLSKSHLCTTFLTSLRVPVDVVSQTVNVASHSKECLTGKNQMACSHNPEESEDPEDPFTGNFDGTCSLHIQGTLVMVIIFLDDILTTHP